MLADRFGLPLSTLSAAARDAYVDASERALTFYPGALAAYDDALAADPNFALAHAGKAQVLMREGNAAGALVALLTAKELAVGLTARETSHIAIFDLGSNGQTEAAIAAVRNHLAAWPLDALVISIAANPKA
jgi:tetratricopeptide (TPR) repeat protein